jgi:hypothetical protein
VLFGIHFKPNMLYPRFVVYPIDRQTPSRRNGFHVLAKSNPKLLTQLRGFFFTVHYFGWYWVFVNEIVKIVMLFKNAKLIFLG